jgi:hypothetical protein
MNERELAFCNVDKYHTLGYKGKGRKIAVKEVYPGTFNSWTGRGVKIVDPFNSFKNYYDTHEQNVVDTALITAPEAEIHFMGDAPWPKVIQYCIDNNIDVLNYSGTGSYITPEFDALEQKAIANGTILLCAAGNDGEGHLTGFARKSSWISVGAVGYNASDVVVRQWYSSYDKTGTDLDCMGFSNGLRVSCYKQNNDGWMGLAGTSFSTPWVAGMIAIYKEAFYDAHNVEAKMADIQTAIKQYSVDIDAQGLDNTSGYGVFKLPNIEVKPMDKMVLKIGEVNALFNGNPITLSIAPREENGSTLVGVRGVFEQFGLDVKWDQKLKTITITKE